MFGIVGEFSQIGVKPLARCLQSPCKGVLGVLVKGYMGCLAPSCGNKEIQEGTDSKR